MFDTKKVVNSAWQHFEDSAQSKRNDATRGCGQRWHSRSNLPELRKQQALSDVGRGSEAVRHPRRRRSRPGATPVEKRVNVLRTRLIRRRAALRRRWVVGAADEVVQADVEEVGELNRCVKRWSFGFSFIVSNDSWGYANGLRYFIAFKSE